MQQHQFRTHPSNYLHLKVVFLFLILMVTSVQCDDYLKEAPSFLIPCKLSDPENGVCLANIVENIFTNWKNGVPGLKNLGKIDPLQVKKVHMEQNNPTINLKADLKDVVITGLSKTKVIKASVNNEYNFKFFVKIPSLRTKGNYRMKGTILNLNLDSAGPMQAEISDVEVIFALKAKLIVAHNHKFFDIIALKSSVKNVGKFSAHYGNLFSSSVELGESANAVFNENWRDLFEIMRPVIEETLDAVTFNRYKKIFNYIPANYIFIDLP